MTKSQQRKRKCEVRRRESPHKELGICGGEPVKLGSFVLGSGVVMRCEPCSSGDSITVICILLEVCSRRREWATYGLVGGVENKPVSLWNRSKRFFCSFVRWELFWWMLLFPRSVFCCVSSIRTIVVVVKMVLVWSVRLYSHDRCCFEGFCSVFSTGIIGQSLNL